MMIPSILFIAAIGGFSALAFNDTCYGPPFQGGGPEGHVYSGDSPCSQSTDDNVARACCGYSDGSICLSNGLCFVPQNNSILQGSCTDPNWTSPGCPETKCVDSNLIMCETTSGDVPAPGDAGGLWYCGTQTESCADAQATFGIQQGFFADYRNSSSSSSAAATPTKSTASVSSVGVTAGSGGSAVAATGTQSALESSCPSSTPLPQRSNTLSGGAIAGIAIGVVCAALIGFGIGILFPRRRRGGKSEAVQSNEGNPLPQHWDTARETVMREEPIRELATNYHRAELTGHGVEHGA